MKLLEFIKSIFLPKQDNEILSPIPLEKQPSSKTPTPTPTPNYVRAIRMGLKEYFGKEPPVATLAASFVKEALKNNIHPYTLPAVSVPETSGGKNETIPNNPINWAPNEPTFKPKTPEETIEKASSGIGTGRAFPYYKDFRQTGKIEDLAKSYAPPSENDTENWIRLVKRLIELMKKYE